MWTCQGQSVHNLWAAIWTPNRTRWVTCKNAWVALWTKKMSSPADRFERMSEVEIRRSRRRKRTVSAHREGDKTIVLMPAHLSAAEEERVVRSLVERLDRREKRARPSDDELMERAAVLSGTWLEGKAVPLTVRWVSNQNARWGSCSSADRSIRLSDRLKGMPSHVVDYVLLHELAHLIEPNHSKRFWALVDAYPQATKAKGFLEGVSWTQR